MAAVVVHELSVITESRQLPDRGRKAPNVARAAVEGERQYSAI